MKIKQFIKSILNSYSEIFFLENPIAGLLFLLITFINPYLGISGILAVLSAYLFAKFLNLEKEFLESGFYTYNALLVGLSIGYLFKFGILTLFLVFISGILTLVFSMFLYSIFSYYLKLPILSIPFTVISSIIYLSVAGYTNLFIDALYPHFNILVLEEITPQFLSGFFKSLGAIIFSPYVFTGIIISIVLFFISRILFFLALIGYYIGAFTIYLFKGSFYNVFSDISSFNFILIAVALGGIFLIPSIKSYFIAITAVITSTIVLSATKSFWSFYGIPVFTLPFNLITLMFLYVIGIVGFPYIAKIIRKTPEETLDLFLTSQKRFQGTERGIHLPFAGEWTVWQGFDGKWTHKGQLKYAYDFVITDENGKTYTNEGLNLTDYYAFRKPVLSPIRGRVVKVISDLPDNEIGTVDKENNWGNYVVIYDERGFYVEISHFAQDSIKVKVGDWVEVGTFLGLCGNSGYSPQPHIHVQVQLYPEVGSPTLPFSFVSFISNNEFFSNDLPKEGEKIKPAFADRSKTNKLSFYLDNSFIYEVFIDNKKIDEFEMSVKMAVDGTFYFDTGKGKLYFGKANETFYFYRLDGFDEYLKDIFISAPKIPLTSEKNVIFKDFLPFKLTTSKILKDFILFIASFNHSVGLSKYEGKTINEKIIEGKVYSIFSKKPILTKLELDDVFGIKKIKVGNRTYKLKTINFGG
ncbi:MAG: peptidase M23 [Hydrogenothermus sp.]|nr:MAG: peptidase M23 [Hydrogenothermus sp.]